MGKLIVFEGTDGTGKSTQFALLTKRLQSENSAVCNFHSIWSRRQRSSACT